MGLKYIYAGYSKCGTKTIAAAFRKLGFNVVDYEETMLDYRTRWNEYLKPSTTPKQKIKIVQQMYKDVDIVFDVPHYFLWKELMDAFPEAKCIFWAREEDSWWNSFHKQLLSGSGSTIKLAEKLHFREVLGSFRTKSENFMKMKVDETIS